MINLGENIPPYLLRYYNKEIDLWAKEQLLNQELALRNNKACVYDFPFGYRLIAEDSKKPKVLRSDSKSLSTYISTMLFRCGLPLATSTPLGILLSSRISPNLQMFGSADLLIFRGIQQFPSSDGIRELSGMDASTYITLGIIDTSTPNELNFVGIRDTHTLIKNPLDHPLIITHGQLLNAMVEPIQQVVDANIGLPEYTASVQEV